MVDALDIETYSEEMAPGGEFNREESIKACTESYRGDLKSYQIIEEINDGNEATFKVEMESLYDSTDEVVTETFTFHFIQRDDGWKVTSSSNAQ